MNPISETAFYCTGVRMLDAKKPKPLCNDFYAHRFMDTQGKKVMKRFRYDYFPNVSNVVRHRVIDDLIRDRLKENSDIPIFIIGCGFDSRAYRLHGGSWTELDEPQIIENKNDKLPILDCPNELQRIAIDFSEDSIKDKLSQHATSDHCLIIVEGVFLYLQEQAIKELLEQLQTLFPKHIILCDLMTNSFFKRFAKRLHKKFKRMGANFNYVKNNPEDRFKIHGYKLKNRVSIIKRSIELKALPYIPDSILNTFLQTLRDGYAVYIFEFNQK